MSITHLDDREDLETAETPREAMHPTMRVLQQALLRERQQIARNFDAGRVD